MSERLGTFWSTGRPSCRAALPSAFWRAAPLPVWHIEEIIDQTDSHERFCLRDTVIIINEPVENVEIELIEVVVTPTLCPGVNDPRAAR